MHAPAAVPAGVLPPPLVSIVIDNYNYGAFLAQCIDSALAQTHAPTEVIVVDDASTDESAAVIARYAGRVRAVLLPQNRGQAGAFNAGFAASSGAIVMFLDADDWLYPQAAARVVAAWQPGESKTHFRLDIVAADGGAIDVHPALEVRLDGDDVRPLLYEFGRYETTVTTGNAFARSALLDCMPIPENEFRIAADGYLSTAVPFHGPVVTLDERLGAYRVHGRNAYAVGGSTDTLAALVARLRARLQHDLHKDAVLRARAAAAGVQVGAAPCLRDPVHLELRLASLRLDRRGHIYKQDGALDLAWRGVFASRRLRLSWPRRLVSALWFAAAGLLPAPLARPAISWKLLPGNRPAAIDRALKRLRRWLR